MTTPDSRALLDIERLRADPVFEIARVCQIGEEDLGTALLTQASLYAFARGLYSKAKAEKSRAEWRYDKAEAKAYARLRSEDMAIGDSKKLADVQSEVVDAKADVLEADAEANMMYALVAGLEKRQEMLIQLSARERQEKQMTPR